MSIITARVEPTAPNGSAGCPSAGPPHRQADRAYGQSRDRTVVLSTLWVFAVLNYLYADVFGLYFVPAATEQAQTTTGGSPWFVLAFAVLMETAIAMVLLSRVLPYTANRWANIAAGLLHTMMVAGTLSLTPYYLVFATVEVACTLFIVWYAWTWRGAERRPQEVEVELELDAGAARR